MCRQINGIDKKEEQKSVTRREQGNNNIRWNYELAMKQLYYCPTVYIY